MTFNEEFQIVVLPVIVYFIICNVVGFVGNTAVLYVYRWRYPRNRYRLLVLIISVVDLTACCTVVPLETISTWFWFDAPSTAICKAKNFFVVFNGLAATYMLFITAIYKFRRICRPFGRQVTETMILILASIGVLFAIILGTPAFILFDLNNGTVNLNNKTEEIFTCGVHKSFRGTLYPAIFRHCLTVYSIAMITTAVLYIFVAKTTLAHVRNLKMKRKVSIQATSESSLSNASKTALSTISQAMDKTPKRSQGLTQSAKKETNKSETEKRSKNRNTEGQTISSEKSGSKSQLSATQIRAVLIMTIIATTCSITFLMGLIIGYVFVLRANSDFSSTGEMVALFACYRIYFINYAVNPVVYLILDRKFREELIKAFRSLASLCRN